ncbi:aminotransferase class I/II-fold pyridoxal phosphate-dependent enzyme [Butyrivibrio sp. FCS014]|uniref:aminotransferase class I/II-fold pyridoxal phosphate-dependent enzyme n=1 Tax=Butyrivibrio sp. FCS014 TaxID=1408304 RepID=UPI00046398F2|nr:aminotransferase class I/II-fold pyridoxal phosphate-dependent enzyme [Butyrivibrio sp. FCS014]
MIVRDLLINRAGEDKQYNLYLAENDINMSYRELFCHASAVAKSYTQAGIGKGDLILIQAVEPLYTFMGFWGAILIGAVPALYPINADIKQHIPALAGLCQQFGIKYIYSDMMLGAALSQAMSQTVIIPSEYEDKSGEMPDLTAFDDIKITEEDTAVLQFSSGSTGNPKGVLLSNKNVVANAFATAGRIDLGHDDNVFNWLPLSHDFAILAMHMCPIALGCDQICMKPTTFLRTPSIWAKTVTSRGATFSPMPNFAMNLIMKTFNEKDYEGVDFSSFKGAVSAGEGISAGSCEMFWKTLSPYGFKESAVIPAYGLAEATVTVSLGHPKEERQTIYVAADAAIGDRILGKEKAEGARLIMGCGRLISCNEVFICDDDYNVLEDGYIGNIMVHGDNVTAGYYKNPEATKGILRPNGDLDTGDIGFMYNGEIFISGRRKEMIIVNGRNYFSADIEMAVRSSVEALRERPIAAFQVHDEATDTEKLYIAVESQDPSEEALSAEVHNAVLKKLHIPCEKVVFLPELPKTASGKVRYYLLTRKYEDEKNDLKNRLIAIISDSMEEKLTEADYDRPFAELGIDSIGIEKMFSDIEKEFGVSLSVDILWSYPTLNKLMGYLKDKVKEAAKAPLVVREKADDKKRGAEGSFDGDIAVVSMACHFPGESDSPAKFWEMLESGTDAIDYPDDERVRLTGDEDLGRLKAGYIRDIDKFDCRKYGITPKEAIKMDPQQRILLRTVSELMLDSGRTEADFDGSSTGVYIGLSNHDYASLFGEEDKDLYFSTGNSTSIIANRLSYIFNLNGPSIAIDTACSSSLVAVHMGANAIRNGECTQAICGGVNILLEPAISRAFENANMLSPDSKCKTCDESANGYVRGEGCGVVLLKKYSDAVKDGDRIYAVIAGSAVNQDARSNGLTAPNGKAQEEVIGKALSRANLRPGDVDYIELHGTGTKLGDPIELNSIGAVFGQDLEKSGKELYVGSVKTNIGHLESAAGIAGFIKAALVLSKGQIPKSLNYVKKNPYIKTVDNIRVADKLTDLGKEDGKAPAVAGVSSFGFGGTNCHVILKSAGQQDISVLNAEVEKGESYFITPAKRSAGAGAGGAAMGGAATGGFAGEGAGGAVTYGAAMGDASAAGHGAGAGGAAASIRDIVCSALSKVTAYPVDTLHDEDKLQLDLGIDSIMMTELVTDLTATFSFDKDQIKGLIAAASGEETTISDLVDIIEKAGGVAGEAASGIVVPPNLAIAEKVAVGTAKVVRKMAPDQEAAPFGEALSAAKSDSSVEAASSKAVAESSGEVAQESSISEFAEYKAIHQRLENVAGNNPYYKVNYAVPRDIIKTDDGDKINYSTYNYVGLNGNKEVIKAAQDAVEKYGTSVSGSRMISGEIDLHRKLENAITEFLGTEDTIVYIGGYTTNVSAISTVVSTEDLILHDSLSHNSIITGCRLSGAKRMSFKHNDMASLEDALKRVRKYYRRVLIVVEGVYSMDGDICNLPELIRLKKQYGALLMVDEAHSLGTIGDCGRGVGSYFGVDRKDVDLWMGTMSKSLASCGGYISGSKEIVELLKYTSDGFMFSVGISPSNAGAALGALNILKSTPELVKKLEHNSKYFLNLMKEKGLDTGLAEGTAVVPCIIKDSNKCMEISQKLYRKGINVMPIVYPAVSEEEARLRFFISSEHTEEEMRYTVDVLSRML